MGLFLKIYLLFILCLSACLNACKCLQKSTWYPQRRAVHLKKLELQVVVSHRVTMWVLGTEPWSSAKVISALNH